MDQYPINVAFTILYFDLLEMIEVLRKSGDEIMEEYADELTRQYKQQIESNKP